MDSVPWGSPASEKPPPPRGLEGGGEHSLWRHPASSLPLRCSVPPPAASCHRCVSSSHRCVPSSPHSSLLAGLCLWSLPPATSPSCSWSFKVQWLPVIPHPISHRTNGTREENPAHPGPGPWLPLQPRFPTLVPMCPLQVAALHLAHWCLPSLTWASGSAGDDRPRCPRQSPGQGEQEWAKSMTQHLRADGAPEQPCCRSWTCPLPLLGRQLPE